MPFRGRGTDTQNHNAVWIGWNNCLAPVKKDDAAGRAEATRQPRTKRPRSRRYSPVARSLPADGQGELGPPATYSISVPGRSGPSGASATPARSTSRLPRPTPSPARGNRRKKEEDEAKPAEPKTPAPKAAKPPPKKKEPPTPKKKKEEPDLTPVDLTVELVDTAGHAAKLPLSRFGIARHPLDARIYRREGRDAQRFTNIYELIPQTFVMPLADFSESAPDFDPRQIAPIRLVFDRTEAGTIVLEHVGLSTPKDPAILAASVR